MSTVIGHSTPLLSLNGHNTTLLTLSYWRSLEHVHAFAHSPVHRQAWDWWAHTRKQFPHIGLMHEAFESEAGSWENLYDQFAGVGMGEWTWMLLNLFPSA